MPIGPVFAFPAAATRTKAIIRGAPLPVDTANSRAASLKICLNGQTGTLQCLIARDAVFLETNTLGGNLAIAEIDHHRDLILIAGPGGINGHENHDQTGETQEKQEPRAFQRNNILTIKIV